MGVGQVRQAVYDARREHVKNRRGYPHVMLFREHEIPGIVSGQVKQAFRPIHKHYHVGELYECRTNPFYRSTAFAVIKIIGVSRVSKDMEHGEEKENKQDGKKRAKKRKKRGKIWKIRFILVETRKHQVGLHEHWL